jgi:transposase
LSRLPGTPPACGRTRSPGRGADPEARRCSARRQAAGRPVPQEAAQSRPEAARPQAGRRPRQARPPPPPDQVAECHEAPLPDACPHCRGRPVETGTADQFQAEIPRKPLIRRFRVHVGHCGACGKRTQGRHPLQTSDALGAAASQVGPDAQAAAAVLHTQMGLSHGKVASVFRTLSASP